MLPWSYDIFITTALVLDIVSKGSTYRFLEFPRYHIERVLPAIPLHSCVCYAGGTERKLRCIEHPNRIDYCGVVEISASCRTRLSISTSDIQLFSSVGAIMQYLARRLQHLFWCVAFTSSRLILAAGARSVRVPPSCTTK